MEELVVEELVVEVLVVEELVSLVVGCVLVVEVSVDEDVVLPEESLVVVCVSGSCCVGWPQIPVVPLMLLTRSDIELPQRVDGSSDHPPEELIRGQPN